MAAIPTPTELLHIVPEVDIQVWVIDYLYNKWQYMWKAMSQCWLGRQLQAPDGISVIQL